MGWITRRSCAGVWSLAAFIILLVRTVQDGDELWSRFTNWVWFFNAFYYGWLALNGPLHFRLVVLQPILVNLTLYVALATVLMTYDDAEIIRDARHQYGSAITVIGNFIFHGWTTVVVIVFAALLEETLLREHMTQFRKTWPLPLSHYYGYIALLTSITILGYYAWFRPSVYYGVDHLSDVCIVAVSFPSVWAVQAAYEGWLHVDVSVYDTPETAAVPPLWLWEQRLNEPVALKRL